MSLATAPAPQLDAKKGAKPKYYPYSGTEEERARLSEVLKGRLYLTNYKGAQNGQEVARLGISHIVSVGTEFKDYTPLAETHGVKYYQLNIEDDEDQAAKFSKVVHAALDFVAFALKPKHGQRTNALGRAAPATKDKPIEAKAAVGVGTTVGAKTATGSGVVLVHCAAGISRSATLVCAYLIREERMRLMDAFDHLYSSRNVVWPNNGFMAMLVRFEKDALRARARKTTRLGGSYRASKGGKTKSRDSGRKGRSVQFQSKRLETPKAFLTPSLDLEQYRAWGEFE